MRGRTRTLTLCLERRLGKRIPPRHPLIAWIDEQSSTIIRYRVRGTDGRTPYERIRLRPWRTEFVGFGGKLRFRLRPNERVGDEDLFKLHIGVFLGFFQKTGQYIGYDPSRDVIMYSRTVHRLPDERKCDAEALEKLSVTPYSLHAPPEQKVHFPAGGDPEEFVRDRPGLARRVYLKNSDFKAPIGLTDGCPKCDHWRRYGPGRTNALILRHAARALLLSFSKHLKVSRAWKRPSSEEKGALPNNLNTSPPRRGRKRMYAKEVLLPAVKNYDLKNAQPVPNDIENILLMNLPTFQLLPLHRGIGKMPTTRMRAYATNRWPAIHSTQPISIEK